MPFISRQGNPVGSGTFAVGLTPFAGQQVILCSIVVGDVVVPGVAARGVVGVEPGRFVLPGDAVPDDVPYAVFAAADLEAVTVSRRGFGGPVVGESRTHGKTIVNNDRKLLGDKIVPVVGVPPGAAALEPRSIAGFLVMDAEPVAVLPVALRRTLIVIIVRIAVKDQVASVPVGDGKPRALVVMEIARLKNDITAGIAPDAVVGRAARLGNIAYFKSLEMQPAAAVDTDAGGGGRRERQSGKVKDRLFARICPKVNTLGVGGPAPGDINTAPGIGPGPFDGVRAPADVDRVAGDRDIMAFLQRGKGFIDRSSR